jgi:hypothetical protein
VCTARRGPRQLQLYFAAALLQYHCSFTPVTGVKLQRLPEGVDHGSCSFTLLYFALQVDYKKAHSAAALLRYLTDGTCKLGSRSFAFRCFTLLYFTLESGNSAAAALLAVTLLYFTLLYIAALLRYLTAQS